MKELFLGEAVRQRRIDLGLSQEELCEGICDRITLSRLETGRQLPAHNHIKALLQRLNMPDNRYYALLSRHELELENTRKELQSCSSRFERAGPDRKKQAWERAMKQISKLESLMDKNDHVTFQFILCNRATLGKEDGPYSLEERLSLLQQALRLTVPHFDPDKLPHRRYTTTETKLIGQIANTYSRAGDRVKALELYSKLFDYVRKNDDHLSGYATNFTLVAHNYSRELCLYEYFHKSIMVAEEGRQVSINYGYYQFLPGFLAILGECFYLLGEEEKSKAYCVQAHYLYQALGDENSLRFIDPDIHERFHLTFPV